VTERNENARIGLWLIGARGSVATCTAYGVAGLVDGLLEPIGLVTAREPFATLELASYDQFVLGGHDVCTRELTRSAGELVAHGILKSDLVTSCSARAAAFEANIRPGILDDADVGFADVDPDSMRLGSLAPLERIEALRADLDDFEERHGLERTIVVNVASTEVVRDPREEWTSLELFESALQAGESQPASTLYAYAALASGRPYVNFTPGLGASIPALAELAQRSKLPYCGNDAKTGETLVKTVLAPLFVARNLRVLAWQGYNMLGNRDGEVLADPLHRQAKLKSKNDALRKLLGDPDVHTHVGIDYVPSLQDWKTAWDFIHFEGFLGAKMSLQFTWMGSDSALAAPLVIDLARLAEFSARRGEHGAMKHTASFFKSPIAGGTHDFHEQMRELLTYVERHRRR
jgi:myo-inositol-1-phosphate synthase